MAVSKPGAAVALLESTEVVLVAAPAAEVVSLPDPSAMPMQTPSDVPHDWPYSQYQVSWSSSTGLQTISG